MEWYNHLYLGEGAAKKQFKFLRKINKRWLSNAYVVALPTNSDNVLDIYSYNELLQKHYKKSNLFIIGLADGKDEALLLVQDIIMDIYRTYGSVKVANYIPRKE